MSNRDVPGLFEESMRGPLRAFMAAQGATESTLQSMERVMLDTLGQMALCANLKDGATTLPGLDAVRLPGLPQGAGVGCAGVPGAYAHIACGRLFEAPDISFFEEHGDVVEAVATGKVDFAVLPIENSSAGAVSEVLALMQQHSLYVNSTVQIKVSHCLCAHPESDPKGIRRVLSHPQALAQCQGYLKEQGYVPEKHSNTAAAAKLVGEGGPSDRACLCSALSAELYGLQVLKKDAQDFDENYTRFVCISPRNILLPGANAISLTLATANEPGALSRLLTRFAVCNLDLSKLMSMPIASRDFHVRFFLDFAGDIGDPQVVGLLSALHSELADFRFLGNYRTVPAAD